MQKYVVTKDELCNRIRPAKNILSNCAGTGLCSHVPSEPGLVRLSYIHEATEVLDAMKVIADLYGYDVKFKKKRGTKNENI